MNLFDTLTHTEKPMVKPEGRPLGIYCCGPTVYGPAHIGNFRSFVLQDVLRRTLETDKIPILHVRNITNVDDKTIRQSRAEGRSLSEFTKFWADRFHKDCAALNLLPPNVEPGAVEHIEQQIALIQKLVEKNHAYIKEGSVYFRVSSFPSYGCLSRLKERKITTSQEPDAEDADEYVRESAADFALWKAHKPEDGDVFWPSPWGEGRPGWHIECSAMAMNYLGETMDLHSGGVDLCFPHHENEIAQSEAVTGKSFSRHWFHITHLLVEDKKMSKSLGNLYTLDDVMKRGYTPMELRYVLLSGHYRQPLNFTWESLDAAHSALEKMAKFDQLFQKISKDREPPQQETYCHECAFVKPWMALNDDLNTPKALGEMFTAMKQVEADIQKGSLGNVRATWHCWLRLLYALGLNLPRKKEPKKIEIPKNIQELAQQRWEAKQAKNWALADDLRKKISTLGWTIHDKKDDYEIVPN